MTSRQAHHWRQKALRITALVGAGLILALPVVTLGLPRFAHDGDINVLRAMLFSDQLWDGDLYPRWLAAANAGLGSPTFYFYPPVPFYAASLFRPLFPSYPDGWRQAGWAVALALLGSGLCCYVWLRATAGTSGALGAAILYMGAPYHLAVDVYARGAFAELWAFVWMPFILYCVRGLSSGPGLVFPGLAVGFALLVMSHPPSVLIFFIVPILYALLPSEGRRRSAILGSTLGALLLGAGLSAVYWIPAVMTQDNASFGGMESGNFDYTKRFLFTKLFEWDNFDTKVSWVTLDTAALAWCAACVAGRAATGLRKRETRFWLFVTVSSVLMMTPLSAPVWRGIPLLPKLQFPFRFDVLLTLATAPLLAVCFASIPKPCPGRVRVLLTAIVLAVAASGAAMARSAWSAYRWPGKDSQHLASIQERLELKMEGDEVRPRWAMPFSARDLRAFLEETDPVLFLAGEGRFTLRRFKPGDILIEVESVRGGRLGVRQFYYPGWEARLLRTDRELAVKPSEPEGWLELEVPSGHDLVRLRLQPGAPERTGLRISAASGIALLVLVARLARARDSLSNKTPL